MVFKVPSNANHSTIRQKIDLGNSSHFTVPSISHGRFVQYNGLKVLGITLTNFLPIFFFQESCKLQLWRGMDEGAEL